MGRMSLSLTERAEKRRRQELAGNIPRRRPPEMDMAMTVGDAAAPTKQKGRSTNYTEAEDIALVKAWEVTPDAVSGNNDQTGKGYWQRITNEFYRLMQPETSSRSLRSLQGRYNDIKQLCGRWSACLEQVRSAPPSGCAVDDYDRVAQERYKQIAASKGKAFGFQHCWKLLEHSEKWKLMGQEGTPPKKRRLNSPANELDDDDGNDDGDGEPASTGNIERPDEMMKGKDNLMLMDQEGPPPKKRRSVSPTTDLDGDDDDDHDDDDDEGTPASTRNMREKIDEIMNARKEMTTQVLQMKKELAEKKRQDKMAVEKRKMDLEERRLLLEEKRLRQEIIAEENKLMMMDPNGMDETARAWWDIRRREILQSRVWAAGMRDGGLTSDGNGGVA